MPIASAERAAINRENAQHSTGPKTEEGKQRSSQNAFQHGLYSRALILPAENGIEYYRMRDALFAEYQPATATESLLVDQLAQSSWRIRRYQRIAFLSIDVEEPSQPMDCDLLVLAERFLASAERAFHRALSSLLKLRKECAREDKQPPATGESTHQPAVSAHRLGRPKDQAGFVPSETPQPGAPRPSAPKSGVPSPSRTSNHQSEATPGADLTPPVPSTGTPEASTLPETRGKTSNLF